MSHTTGTLYIVATPIGNLADMSHRGISILSEVGLILAEDTRHASKLLKHYEIKTRVRAYHEHNAREVVVQLIEALESGENLALISDAGTPLISDPGYRLVRSARQQGITVTPIPGACAMITGLSAAGIATDRFCFEGFLPAKQSARRDSLINLAHEKRSLVFYESSHRIVESIRDMSDVFGADRYASIGRELTKKFEQFYCGSLGQLLTEISDDPNNQKGEFVVIVSGNQAGDQDWQNAIELAAKLRAEMPMKTACRIAAETFPVSKNDLYQFLLDS